MEEEVRVLRLHQVGAVQDQVKQVCGWWLVDVLWCSQQHDDGANIDERGRKKSNMVSNSHLNTMNTV